MAQENSSSRRSGSGRSPIRVLVHDYAGHPFQVQLSRELARRGNAVLHLHFAELQTPKGAVAPREDDAPTFQVRGITLGRPFLKRSIVRRWYQERLYAQNLLELVGAFNPDVVLSANTPLEVQRTLMLACKRRAIRFVPWVQDFYSTAVRTVLTKRFGWAVGTVAGFCYRQIERSILKQSDQIVFITAEFITHTNGWGVDPAKCHVVENWAPLDELPLRARDNNWARRNGLIGKVVILYAGTLGHKHNPRLLIETAEAFRNDGGVAVICVAEGPGREWLEAERNARGLSNMIIIGLQPYDDLPDVLATGDVLIALIEREAGVFSVPSKVLSYLCAARPLLLAVPRENLAARTVARAGAGLVVDPTDLAGFVQAAQRLAGDKALRRLLAAGARRYAEATFDIATIADRFESILDGSPAPRLQSVDTTIASKDVFEGGKHRWIEGTSSSSPAAVASSAGISSRT